MKAYTLDSFIKKQLKNPDFKKHYGRELLINAIASMVFELRLSASLTQNELARKAKTTQAVISRIESGEDVRIPSIDLLARIANASHA